MLGKRGDSINHPVLKDYSRLKELWLKTILLILSAECQHPEKRFVRPSFNQAIINDGDRKDKQGNQIKKHK